VSFALPLAHGIGGVKDLPVPRWLFYYGGALVLVLSFVALGALWREPLLDRLRGRTLGLAPGRLARDGVGAVGVVLFVLVTATALVGKDVPGTNLAPTFVYVVFWIGMPLLSALVGDVWRWVSPWRAIADAVAAAMPGWRTPFDYPERLGRYPAALALFAFAALELAWTDPSRPRTIGAAILVYTWVTWLGMAAFGREKWTARGEGFAVYFGLLARLAPLTVRGGRLVARWPLSGLAEGDTTPGTLLFVAVMLGTVGFDGFSRTSWWQTRIFHLRLDHPETAGDRLAFLVNLAGMLAMVGFVAVTFLAAVTLAERVARRPLAPWLLPSLVPIAFAYVVAHYFSLLVLQGQYVAPLASDPFGWGWDLFGTRGVRPDLRLLAPRTVWYVQVGALVIGHVAGLVVAHDRAVALARPRDRAMPTQYPLLALMVLYTVGGMWILSRP
jgi:hypothetical protein